MKDFTDFLFVFI